MKAQYLALRHIKNCVWRLRMRSELIKRQQYARTNIQSGSNNIQARVESRDQATTTQALRPSIRVPLQNCNSPDHLENSKRETAKGGAGSLQRGELWEAVENLPSQSEDVLAFPVSQKISWPRMWIRIHWIGCIYQTQMRETYAPCG